jgi:hypothetical protein
LTDGAVYDARGGVPSDVVLSTIEIPAGGTSLTIKAPSRGPDFLVRVVAHPAPEPVADEAPPVALAALATPPAEPSAVARRSHSLDECRVRGPNAPGDRDPAPVESEPRSFLEAHPIDAGPELGLGAPARGDSRCSIGECREGSPPSRTWSTPLCRSAPYRVGVLETHPVNDPYAGPITVGADYHTTVVPVEIAGTLPRAR